MAEEGTKRREPWATILDALHAELLFVFWLFCVAYRLVAHPAALVWIYVYSKPWRRIVALALVSLSIFAGIKFVPLLYARFDLVSEAEFLARTSMGRSDDETRELLVRKAFQCGFTDVMEEEHAFTIEHSFSDEGLSLCTVTMDVRQPISIVGSLRVPFRVRTRVTKPVDPMRERPANLTDWIDLL
jgi:hypothetical protein